MGTGYYNMSGRNNDAFSTQLRNNMSNSLGFNLRIPIFNKFQVRNNIHSADLAMPIHAWRWTRQSWSYASRSNRPITMPWEPKAVGMPPKIG